GPVARVHVELPGRPLRVLLLLPPRRVSAVAVICRSCSQRIKEKKNRSIDRSVNPLGSDGGSVGLCRPVGLGAAAPEWAFCCRKKDLTSPPLLMALSAGGASSSGSVGGRKGAESDGGWRIGDRQGGFIMVPLWLFEF
uniref:Uncharacterized protein n=1 Tax=Triticum urartu TaxID=4572 RepID=A0A8R7RBT0_TRIUA